MPGVSEVTKKLSLLYPWVLSPFIVSAPMRVMSGPALAVAVSRAGGLGFIGPGVKTRDMLADLEEATALVGKLRTSSSNFHALLPAECPLPVGVGFQLWSDNLEVAVAAVEKFRPCAAWLYAPRNGQRDFDAWSLRIRSASPRIQIWIQIGTLAEAKELVQSSVRPDVIVIQGTDAGGHGRAKDGLGLLSLFPEVADALAGSQIPLFAAGGIADARGVLAAMCLGASGVVMGTRFLVSHEARINPGYQREIVRASDGAVTTARTLLYNKLRGTKRWPEEYSPRTIINKSFIEYQAGRPFEELKKLHDEALKAGDSGWGPEGRLATYAGASIGLIHEIKDAATIIRDVREGVLLSLPSLRGH
ncbi:nitronate monooxygenase [Aspergillus lentulus]|uniref:Nitronate monooxygenase n=1 Tax=Aspergillus lentulus TaxID=293939 RepID=A0ABQ1A7K2_ASPLE|nr:nitronate monooxygenase [Aspergillus lentulus]